MNVWRLEFTADQLVQSGGGCDLLLISPNGKHQVELPYHHEPPHGDSIHTIKVDGRPFPGWAWGGTFNFSSCSRYLTTDWMEEGKIERHTIVIDLEERRFRMFDSKQWLSF